MKLQLFLILISCLFILIETPVVFSENTGASDIMLAGGSTGKVPFPHHRHQKALNNDCQVCHKLFPQVKGSIVNSIQQGTLKKKTVMNNCQSCHKDMVSQGKATGPVKCKECHSN